MATINEDIPILIWNVSEIPCHKTANVAPPNPAYHARVIP